MHGERKLTKEISAKETSPVWDCLFPSPEWFRGLQNIHLLEILCKFPRKSVISSWSAIILNSPLPSVSEADTLMHSLTTSGWNKISVYLYSHPLWSCYNWQNISEKSTRHGKLHFYGSQYLCPCDPSELKPPFCVYTCGGLGQNEDVIGRFGPLPSPLRASSLEGGGG